MSNAARLYRTLHVLRQIKDALNDPFPSGPALVSAREEIVALTSELAMFEVEQPRLQHELKLHRRALWDVLDHQCQFVQFSVVGNSTNVAHAYDRLMDQVARSAELDDDDE